MPRTGWKIPYGADQTLFLVVDRQGRHGGLYCEIEIERTDRETIVGVIGVQEVEGALDGDVVSVV